MRCFLATSALFAAFVTSACGGDGPPPPDVVARLPGVDVRYEEFEGYLALNLGEDGHSLDSDVLSELFDQFLDEVLLARLAAERGLAENDLPRQQAAEAILNQAVEDQAPSSEELRRLYESRRASFSRPARIRLLQLLVEEREAADQAQGQLQEGADFLEVAEELSVVPPVPFGGEGGALTREDLPPAFADRIFALAPGEVSELIEADYGFFLFKVLERLPARELSLEEAEAELRHQLRGQTADRALAELIQESRDLYEPRIYERHLPFNYLGRYAPSAH